MSIYLHKDEDGKLLNMLKLALWKDSVKESRKKAPVKLLGARKMFSELVSQQILNASPKSNAKNYQNSTFKKPDESIQNGQEAETGSGAEMAAHEITKRV